MNLNIKIESAPLLKNGEALAFLLKEVFEFTNSTTTRSQLAGLCVQHEDFDVHAVGNHIAIHEAGKSVRLLLITGFKKNK